MLKIRVSKEALCSCHVVKVLERILNRRIRKSVEIEIVEEQQDFRKGSGTMYGMFLLRQLVEKSLEV